MNFPLWLALTLSASHAYALAPRPTQFILDSWSTKTGIPEEMIYSVTQTSDGYLWLATANGLVQYDGREFQIHQPKQNLGGAAKQDIFRLGQGPRNSVWVYSLAYGLVRYEKGVFQRAPKYPLPCRVEQIREDRNGTLVVCKERVLRIVDERVIELTRNPSEPPVEIRSAARDDEGRLWAGLSDGSLAQVGADGSLTVRYGAREGMPSASINFILYAGAKGLWAATDSGLVMIRDGRVKLFTTREGLPHDNIRRLTMGRDGSVWVGTKAGITLYRDGHFESFHGVSGLPADWVQSIFEDREESVWITFSKTGLFRLRKPKFLTWGASEGLLNERAMAVVQSRDATWIAHASGLQRIRGGKIEEIALGPKPVPLQSLEEDGAGRIWALTPDAVFVVDPRSARAERLRLPAGEHKMFTINRDRSGRMWIVTEKGLFVGEGNRIQAVPLSGLPAILPRSDVRQSHDGRLWLSVMRAGLFELRDGKAIRVSLGDDPELDRIYTFHIDSNDDFWFGLDGGGLARWRKGRLARYGYQPSRHHNFIYHFAQDEEGFLWLGLRAGLIRVSKAALNNYLDGGTASEPKEDFYDIVDGLRSFNFGVSSRPVPSGEPASVFWFCNLAGVVRIDTRNIPLNRLIPPVHIEDVQADDRKQPIGETVTIPAGTGMLRFEFSVTSLVDGSHVRVRSRLEPFDATWRHHEARAFTYSNVPPGQYTFTVTGTNNDGVWNEQGAKIKVIVLPRFYQTWWFRLLVAALVVSSVAALYRWRTMVLRREKTELEGRVERRTAELSKAKHIAENAAQVKSDFLATMSHEIRTPMHGVLGTVELLSETPLSPKQRDYLDTVRSSSNSLLTLLNDILDLSKIEAGRMELRLAPFSLRKMVEEVAGLLRAQANMKNISIVSFYQPDLPEYFEGDEARLRQVVFNLVGNAVKFTEKGHVTIEISGQQKQEDDWGLNIAIRDTGIGIPQDRISQLFQNFVQVNSSASRPYAGTGLGLAICQRLARMMEGSVTVQSESGRGSTFNLRVSLPRATPASEPDHLPVQMSVNRRFAAHLLLAEDNPVNQRLATALLERLGCTVTVAQNGREAVELAERSYFPIIFMDCQMPEIDGFEASRQIRSRLGDAPVIIAMTANALPGDRERCLEAGMNDYLAKPFQRSDLVGLLNKYLPSEPVAASMKLLGQTPAHC